MAKLRLTILAMGFASIAIMVIILHTAIGPYVAVAAVVGLIFIGGTRS